MLKLIMPIKRQEPAVDLKLDATYLSSTQILALINDSLQDGFNVLAINRTVNPKSDFVPFEVRLDGFEGQEVRVLQRITIKLESTSDLDYLKSRKAVYEKADIVALEFLNFETLEIFLKRYNDYIDNLIYINISTFAVSSTFLKALKNKNYFIEFDYSKLFTDAKKKQALVSLYKLLDSHYDKLLLSSDANNVFERRSEWEIKETISCLMERSEAHSSKMLKQLLNTNPLAVVKRALLRKQGFVYFEHN